MFVNFEILEDIDNSLMELEDNIQSSYRPYFPNSITSGSVVLVDKSLEFSEDRFSSNNFLHLKSKLKCSEIFTYLPRPSGEILRNNWDSVFRGLNPCNIDKWPNDKKDIFLKLTTSSFHVAISTSRTLCVALEKNGKRVWLGGTDISEISYLHLDHKDKIEITDTKQIKEKFGFIDEIGIKTNDTISYKVCYAQQNKSKTFHWSVIINNFCIELGAIGFRDIMKDKNDRFYIKANGGNLYILVKNKPKKLTGVKTTFHIPRNECSDTLIKIYEATKFSEIFPVMMNFSSWWFSRSKDYKIFDIDCQRTLRELLMNKFVLHEPFVIKDTSFRDRVLLKAEKKFILLDAWNKSSRRSSVTVISKNEDVINYCIENEILINEDAN